MNVKMMEHAKERHLAYADYENKIKQQCGSGRSAEAYGSGLQEQGCLTIKAKVLKTEDGSLHMKGECEHQSVKWLTDDKWEPSHEHLEWELTQSFETEEERNSWCSPFAGVFKESRVSREHTPHARLCPLCHVQVHTAHSKH